MTERPVIIMAGGTGGHIFPALAVASELARRQVPVVWLGSEGGMETRIVPQYDIPMVTLPIKGIRGKDMKTLLFAPFKVAAAVWGALAVMRRYRPRSVLGMGGFASGPGGLAAAILRIPVYIHEQNSIAGMTNRWLAKVSRRVMEGFEGTLPGALHLGNPVREEMSRQPDPQTRFETRHGPFKLLVVGGSLGALKLNQLVPEAVAGMAADKPEILHQTGEKHLDVTRQYYANAGVVADVVPFIQDMATAYADADLVIARAGALTVTEIQQIGVASVLVPYPFAVDDHQTTNAQALVAAGAALLMPDGELTVEGLRLLLDEYLTDRKRLLEMARRAKGMARPDAAVNVARICLGEELNTNGGVV